MVVDRPDVGLANARVARARLSRVVIVIIRRSATVRGEQNPIQSHRRVRGDVQKPSIIPRQPEDRFMLKDVRRRAREGSARLRKFSR